MPASKIDVALAGIIAAGATVGWKFEQELSNERRLVRVEEAVKHIREDVGQTRKGLEELDKYLREGDP